MVDCTGGDGCKGGDPADVWLHAATVGGADSSSSYPYISGSTKTVNHEMTIQIDIQNLVE